MKGINGYLIVLRKHIYNFLNYNLTKLFFDALILLTMILLTLGGLVNENIS